MNYHQKLLVSESSSPRPRVPGRPAAVQAYPGGRVFRDYWRDSWNDLLPRVQPPAAVPHRGHRGTARESRGLLVLDDVANSREQLSMWATSATSSTAPSTRLPLVPPRAVRPGGARHRGGRTPSAPRRDFSGICAHRIQSSRPDAGGHPRTTVSEITGHARWSAPFV